MAGERDKKSKKFRANQSGDFPFSYADDAEMFETSDVEGFDHEGNWIKDPTISECGRFPVGSDYYKDGTTRDELVEKYHDLYVRHVVNSGDPYGADWRTMRITKPEVYETMKELLARIRAHDDGVCHE